MLDYTRILKAAARADFKRTRPCCPGVEDKICAGDVWTGNLAGFVHQLVLEFGFVMDPDPDREAAMQRVAERMSRPDMSAEALRERLRKSAEWEEANPDVTAYAGTLLTEAGQRLMADLLENQKQLDDTDRKILGNPSQFYVDD